jgi:hypothetical protein
MQQPFEFSPNAKKKKKVDIVALQSPLMRIPRMDIQVVRDLLDQDINQPYQLVGRAPEALFEEARKKRPLIPTDHLRFFKMAVYYAETNSPDPEKMYPQHWD